MKRRYLICSIVLLGSALFSQTNNLPPDHWAYSFFGRMEMRGAVAGNHGQKPFTRGTAAQIVHEISLFAKKNPKMLTSLDLKKLERLKGEFVAELGDTQDISIQKREYEPHLYSFSAKKRSLYADLVAGGFSGSFRDTDESSYTRTQAYYGGIIRGTYANIGFYSDARIFGEKGGRYTQNYRASLGYPRNVSKDSSSSTWDTADAYIDISYKGISIQYGRQPVQWGYSRYTPLFLSGRAPSFDMLKIAARITPGIFMTYFHGELQSDFNNKWIASHRIDIHPVKTLWIGINEAVVYGRRGIKAAYLNPVIPYLIAEHTLGDKDNVCLGIDTKWIPAPTVKFYCELFIDDLFSPFDICENYWGNKLAFQAGAVFSDAFSMPNTSFSIEYTRIDPYVYTHHDSVNVYSNFSYGLGHILQPNSDQLRIGLEKDFSMSLQTGLHMSWVRHGQGSIARPHMESQGDEKNFLSGIIEKTMLTELLVTIQPMRDVYVSSVLRNISGKNMGRVSGKNDKWNEIAVRASINW